MRTWNGMDKTGNGIISSTSRLLIKKLILQNIFHSTWRVQNQFKKQEIELLKQEMELLFLLTDFWSKNCFTKYFPFNLKSSYPVLETGNSIIETGNGIIVPTCGHLIKNIHLQNIFYSTWRVKNQFKKQKIELLKQEMELFFLLSDFWSKYFPFNV